MKKIKKILYNFFLAFMKILVIVKLYLIKMNPNMIQIGLIFVVIETN